MNLPIRRMLFALNLEVKKSEQRGPKPFTILGMCKTRPSLTSNSRIDGVTISTGECAKRHSSSF